ncbi:penicillin acylase family protein [Allomuricauda sp. SCSIO 65647]|uniref:penicillin acylase family protein n=1 Tax=Allomuricauda sp. SCSIO 65647 TaxID=2908843 RepID=UPI001F3BCC3E|nr:penicillin acylase family protein [Muricauda sp. SCSIO 65647]UJH67496.1 penicillin acylase family protein [Muricauda sp. SCSIO 65647]
MRLLKKVLWVLLALIVIILLGGMIFMNTLTPTYEGEKELSRLEQPVEVYFDTYGIPHIYASKDEDAFRALGYVHAQDRLWQMELLRRVAKGGLSEVFGKDLVKTDKFFLSLGIDENTKETIASLNRDSREVRLAEAYLDGVNQFIEEGPTPVEFYLTGLDKTSFALDDVYNAVGYMAFSFAMAHKTDPLLTDIKNQLGEEYLNDLFIASDTSTVWIKNYNLKETDTIPLNITAMANEALKKLPLPQFEGSNSWVLAPEKTKNGKVILANDPHIGFAQPSVWYEAHISTPTYEKYGYHLAGVPFPLLGHNRDLAYGMTMFENDDIDFYYEQNHPSDSTKYKTEDGYGDYVYVTKNIKVKDAEEVSFTYKKTRHGPVLNGIANQIPGERPIAMSWIYAQVDNEILEALYGITMATDIEEFKLALPKIHAPGLNVMYGDAKGNVAWWASARLYQMPDSLSTKLVLDGTSGTQERLGFLDFSDNPQAINPPWHYVYSANNQPDSIAGMLYPGYYLPENRAKRIVQLLEDKDDWDKASTSEMVLDVTSSVNPGIVADLIKHMEVSELNDEQIKLLDQLKNWEGDYSLESVAGTFYHRSEYFVLKNTFEDELGPERFKQFLSTHFMKRHIAPGARLEEGIWWDDINTQDKTETRYDIILKSFQQAWQSLQEDFGSDVTQWQWQNVHTVEHGHPIGQVKALRKYFNVGPFPVSGTREVINNMSFLYDSTLYYKVNSGPSTRRIVDFSDIENSISILPTGQSGNPLSKHYDDQAEMFVNGEFRKMMMNEEEIKSGSDDLLVFKPKKQ